MEFNHECYSEIDKIMFCGNTGGFDYKYCCGQIEDVPTECLSLCTSESSINNNINFTNCANYLTGFAKCIQNMPCNPKRIGNKICDRGNNFESCGNYDGGDCNTFNGTDWPKCIHNPKFIGDLQCDLHLLSSECNFDSADCCNKSLSGNGKCDDVNNYESCDFDGGDCCDLSLIGNKKCDGVNNFENCHFDGGDCAADNSNFIVTYLHT